MRTRQLKKRPAELTADTARRPAGRVSMVLAFLALSSPFPGHAHQVGLSFGKYTLDESTVVADLVFAGRELATLAPDADRNEDGILDPREAATSTNALAAAVIEPIRVVGEGECPGGLESTSAVEGDGILVHARFVCAKLGPTLSFDLGFLERLEAGHRHVFLAELGGGPVERVAHASQPRLTLEVTHREPPSFAEVATSMLTLGIEHILTGYDHLAFLLGLVIIGGSFRFLLGIVTSFTVAHSLTLGLATLGVLAPSPSIVEPLIALSVAYVGLENLWIRDPRHRWILTFGFGLIHGFGFAGVLRELGLPSERTGLALLTFNVGVELGQLGVLLLVLPALTLAKRKSRSFRERGPKLVSLAIAVLGGYWFLVRLLG